MFLHPLQVWYADFKGGVVAQSCGFESLSLLTRAWSLLSQQVFFFQGGLSPRTHAAGYSRRVIDWG